MDISLINFNDLIESTKKELYDCEEELSKMPEGYLTYARTKSGNGKPSFRHCYREGGRIKQNTIKEGDPLLFRLSRKRYLIKRSKVLKNNLRLLHRIGDDYVNPSFSNIVNSLTQVYADLPGSYYNGGYSKEALEWMKEPYEQDLSYEHYNIIPTSLGFKVKSKGERDIIERMTVHSIPLHYEEILYVDNHKIALDITFKRPSDGKLGYWEHYGLMDKPGYRENFRWKLKELEKIDIYPGNNLIVTFEGRGQFLTPAEIDEIIKSKIL